MKEDTQRTTIKKTTMLTFGCFMFLCGVFVGIQRNVIKALINGDSIPEASSWHFWVR